MKRIALIVCVVLASAPIAFAQIETWTAIGLEFGNFFERASSEEDSIEGRLESSGMTLGVYNFWNGANFGMFIHDAFLIPSIAETTVDGVTTTIDMSGYDFTMQVGIIIGPAFRYSLGRNLKLYCGVGFSYMQTGAIKNGYSLLAYNLGIGGDAGIKFDVSDAMFFSAGATGQLDTRNYTTIHSSYTGDMAGWSSGYQMLAFRPYFGFGFNMYREDTSLGKPKG